MSLTDTLKGLIKLDPATLKFIAPLLLNHIVPKTVHIGGKNVPTAGLLEKVLDDGHIGLEDIAILIGAWHEAPHAAPPAPIPPSGWEPPRPVVPATPWKPPTGSVPAPVPATSIVAALGIEFELQDTIENGRGPIDYKITETEEAYVIELVSFGTTNLPITAGAYLHAVYLDAAGVKINFEDRGTPELYGTAQWIAHAIDDSGEVTIGPGANAVMATKGVHIANFREAEYNRTGGMDVPVHFPPEANEKVIDVTFSVGKITAKPIRFPKVS